MEYIQSQSLVLLFWMTATLRVNDRVNEPLGIAGQLKIRSEVVNFLGQILSSLAYSGSSAVKTLNQVKIPVSVGGFPVDLCDQCCLFSDDQNIQKGNRIVRLSSHSEADGRP
jgi:hypothetical protein